MEPVRIIRDPQNPVKWAYQVMNGLAVVKTVGGFATAREARNEFETKGRRK